MISTVTRLRAASAAIVIVLMTPLLAGQIQPAAAAGEDTITTVLYPGWNLIGWIHADAPVSDLFQQIPELDSVHSGSSAHRDRHDSAGSLRELRTGRGYWLYVRSGEPVEWIRPAAPATRRFQLEPGKQLVAWAGRSGISISDALAGIKDELVVAWRWQALAQRFVGWDPERSQLDSDPVLSRGDALWINLDRPKEWLHPSDAVHPVILEGDGAAGLPDDFRAIVEADVRYAAETVAASFAFEIPLHRLEVRIPTTREAFDVYVDAYGARRGGFVVRAREAEQPHQLVMHAGIWTSNYNEPYVGQDGHGRSVMLHEFFHAVQFEASGSLGPPWLMEGTAIWFVNDVEQGINLGDRPYISNQLDLRTLDFSDAEPPFDTQHDIGTIAVDLLVERAGADAVMDMWRNMSKYPPAATNWAASWQLAFAETFGISFDAFAEQFAELRRNQFTTLSGKLNWAGGAEAIPITIEARMPGLISYFERPEADGSFELLLPRRGAGVTVPERYDLLIKRRDQPCNAAVTRDRTLTWREGEAGRRLGPEHQSFRPSTDRSITNFNISVPAGFCQHRAQVQITGAAPRLDDLEVSFCEPSGAYCYAAEQRDGGIYSALVPLPGRYVAALNPAGSRCRKYAGDAGLVSDPAQARLITAALAGSATPIQLDRQASLCDQVITGQFSGREGSWLDRQYIYAYHKSYRINDGSPYVVKLNADGSFALPVGASGFYRFQLSTRAAHQGGGLSCELSSYTASQWLSQSVDSSMEGAYIWVPPNGAVTINWEIHPDACRHQVSGRVTDEYGAPRPFLMFDGCPDLGWCPIVRTDRDGDFVYIAPMIGATRFSLNSRDPLAEQCEFQRIWGPSHRFSVEPHDDNYVHWIIPSSTCAE